MDQRGKETQIPYCDLFPWFKVLLSYPYTSILVVQGAVILVKVVFSNPPQDDNEFTEVKDKVGGPAWTR